MYARIFVLLLKFTKINHMKKNISLGLHPQKAMFIGAKMGPNWVLLAPVGPHVGPINLAVRVIDVQGIKLSASANEAPLIIVGE